MIYNIKKHPIKSIASMLCFLMVKLIAAVGAIIIRIIFFDIFGKRKLTKVKIWRVRKLTNWKIWLYRHTKPFCRFVGLESYLKDLEKRIYR